MTNPSYVAAPSMVEAAREQEDRAHIRACLKYLNDLWLSGRTNELPAGLGRYLHPRVVFRGPNFEEIARGTAACIANYQEASATLRASTVLGWHFSRTNVDITGDTAVASYTWRLAFRQGKRVQHRSARDTFGLTRYKGQWLVCWRGTSHATSD